MRRLGWILLLVFWFLALVIVPPLFAQPPATSANRFAFDQPAPDLATATSYTYRLYADGATTGTILVVACTGTASPFPCSVPIGAFTPGPHSVTMSAANVAGESARSAPLLFTMVVIPSAPTNLRVQ